MSTYTEKHRAYYLANREKIIAHRKVYEPEWIKTPKGLYSVQRRKAAQRDIPWHFTFESWLKVWQDSGKFEERGDTKGKYCMARLGDIGPYSVENVKIIPFEENSKEAFDRYRESLLIKDIGES